MARRNCFLRSALHLIAVITTVAAVGLGCTRSSRPEQQARSMRPTGWNPHRVWHPNRFWGPFHEGSDLSQIKLAITPGHPAGPGGAWAGAPTGVSVYFNDYFLTHEDPKYYRQYFATTGLGTGSAVPQGSNPGSAALPNEPNGLAARLTPGATDGVIIFALSEIRPASDYGGTIRLRFVQQEDVGLEIPLYADNTTKYSWDLSGMVADVFIRPNEQYFNAPLQRPTQGIPWGGNGRVWVDLSYAGSVMYKSADSGLEIVPASAQQGLPIQLTAAIQALEAGVMQMAARTWGAPEGAFGYLERLAVGFIHTQFTDRVLSSTDAVTWLPIGDGVLGPPFLTATKPYFSVEVQLYDLSSSDRVNNRADFEAKWYYAWFSYVLGRRGSVSCSGNSTSWVNVGTFLLDLDVPDDDLCDYVSEIYVEFHGLFGSEGNAVFPGDLRGAALRMWNEGGWSPHANRPLYDPSYGICDLLRTRADPANRQPGIVKTIDGQENIPNNLPGRDSADKWQYRYRYVLFFR